MIPELAPCGQSSSICLRRLGTVRRIAVNANKNPTSALMTENSVSL